MRGRASVVPTTAVQKQRVGSTAPEREIRCMSAFREQKGKVADATKRLEEVLMERLTL